MLEPEQEPEHKERQVFLRICTLSGEASHKIPRDITFTTDSQIADLEGMIPGYRPEDGVELQFMVQGRTEIIPRETRFSALLDEGQDILALTFVANGIFESVTTRLNNFLRKNYGEERGAVFDESMIGFVEHSQIGLRAFVPNHSRNCFEVKLHHANKYGFELLLQGIQQSDAGKILVGRLLKIILEEILTKECVTSHPFIKEYLEAKTGQDPACFIDRVEGQPWYGSVLTAQVQYSEGPFVIRASNTGKLINIQFESRQLMFLSGVCRYPYFLQYLDSMLRILEEGLKNGAIIA